MRQHPLGGDALVEGAVHAGEVTLGIDATAAVAARETERAVSVEGRTGGAAGRERRGRSRLTPLRSRCER